MNSKKINILITGGCGFVGSNIALKLNSLNEFSITVIDNLSRDGSRENQKLLKKNNINFFNLDISNKNQLNNFLSNSQFDFILNFAGQVSMVKSIENPLNDLSINLMGTINILEFIRNNSPKTKYLNISSNKVYGDLLWDKLKEDQTRYSSKTFTNGYDEKIPLKFSGPYGCSKGAAEQYTIDYSSIYNLNTSSIRLSTIFGPQQYATFDQGWVGWFIKSFLEQKHEDELIFKVQGDGKQVRDILFIQDFANLIVEIIFNFEKARGEVFNVGGGLNNSLSIIELINLLNADQKKYKIINEGWRAADQKHYISDMTKLFNIFEWRPEHELEEGLKTYFNWIESSV